jgi:hypothetical protein
MVIIIKITFKTFHVSKKLQGLDIIKRLSRKGLIPKYSLLTFTLRYSYSIHPSL